MLLPFLSSYSKFDYVPLSVAVLQPPLILPTQLKTNKKWMQMTTAIGGVTGGVNGHAVSVTDPVSVNTHTAKRVQVSSPSHPHARAYSFFSLPIFKNTLTDYHFILFYFIAY